MPRFSSSSGSVTLPNRPMVEGEVEPYSKYPSETRPYALCPPPSRTRVSCMAAVMPTKHGEAVVGPSLEGSGVSGGFSPADLRSAYNLPSTGGEGLTIAITIAYDDPSAESNLATYRSHYGLPACASACGCFQKVNQKGEAANYPVGDSEWALETSLDLDMVSATCPQCHILLVEADSNELDDMNLAVQEASELGADVISNSWAAEEFSGEVGEDHYFDHPGVPTLFASGDWGYGVEYPAASPHAIAVGGTSLKKAANARSWSESAWSGAGSGCSEFETKPSWQKDAGCTMRTVADVSAVASPSTPVSVYDSYGQSGWQLLGGTSVATPLMAGVEALSSSAFRAAGPSAFWRAGNGDGFFDPTDGENGPCAVESESGFDATYLCQGDVGYDGPTGWGTPDGPMSMPVAITEGVAVSSASKAILHGSVDPNGLATEYRFEYGETTSYGTSVPIPDGSVGSGSVYVEVSQAIEGLSGQTPYHYRITAHNTAGTFHGVDRTFGTTKPTATTGEADEIQVHSATVHGTVNPEGIMTAYYFEYGPTTSYGHKAPAKAGELSGGTATAQVSAVLIPLSGGTPYHYRVVAKNAAGTVYGLDKTLVTEPSSWGVAELPQPSNSGNGERAFGVSCLQPNECVAVGENWSLDVHASVTLAERWNGESWSPMSTPYPDGLNEGWRYGRYATLLGVSCTSASSCVAVGRYKGSSEVVEPLAEVWDGSEWSLTDLAHPPGATSAVLEGVSCTSPTNCLAAGHYVNGSGAEKTLIERWDGIEWTIETTPDPTGSTDSWLAGVSCPSSTSCFVAGGYEMSGGAKNTLVEQWSASTWSVRSTPNPGSRSVAALNDISCLSSSACTAVGYYRGSTTLVTLAEHWDGVQWTAQSTPAPIREANHLLSVSCAAPTACTATGTYYNPEETDHGWRSLVERWSGGSWSVLEIEGFSVPSGWWHEESLYGVSCAEPEGCNAVGDRLAAPSGGLSAYHAFSAYEITRGPTAGFSFAPSSPHSGDAISFDASSTTDPAHTIESYSWDFGDGATDTDPDPTHTYTSRGTHHVTLTVTNDAGQSDTSEQDVVADVAPTAAFSPSTAVTTPGSNLNFDANASTADPAGGSIAHYSWDFGDGTTDDTGATPMDNHAYANPGQYTVTLKVTDDLNVTSTTATHTVTVDAVPKASFTAAPDRGDLAVAFDAGGSSDSFGTITSYSWDFGDGATDTDPDPTHTYTSRGTHHVTLTVTNDAGQSDTSEQDVVADVAPTAAFSPSTAVTTPGSNLNFDANASTADPAGGSIAHYSWDFGDGTTDDTGATPMDNHAYANPGQYTVTLKVTDDLNVTSTTATHTVTVDAVPKASFTAAPDRGDLAVAFDAGGSSDSFGTITSYSWDFGDGGHASGKTPSHTYSHAGEYTVTLTVTDDEGETGEVAHVTVADAPPLASFTVGTASPTATQPVPFDASGSSDPDGTITGYSWDFGDGTTGSGAKPSHTYSHAGEYTVTLTVTDDEGEIGEVSRLVSVAQPASSAFVIRRSKIRCDRSIVLSLYATSPGAFRARATGSAAPHIKGAHPRGLSGQPPQPLPREPT